MQSKNKYWISTCPSVSRQSRTILNEYLLSLKLANKAETTISKYRSVLERFLRECTIPVEKLTADDVLKWFQTFSIGKKEKTIDLVLSILSSYFQFCRMEDYMDTIVIKNRWRPKIPQSLPKFLTEQEYASVKMAAEQLPLRDRALILFLLSSGCRRSEVVQLRIGDVEMKKRTAVVKGKGKKMRNIHFSEECRIILHAYLKERVGDPKEPLFMNKFGNGLGENGIYNVVKKVGNLAGLTQKFHPHVCRHTFATEMLARGAELGFIADELGHSDLNTTRIYAQIPTEEMITAYQNIMG